MLVFGGIRVWVQKVLKRVPDPEEILIREKTKQLRLATMTTALETLESVREILRDSEEERNR
jgi:hypothetical protein